MFNICFKWVNFHTNPFFFLICECSFVSFFLTTTDQTRTFIKYNLPELPFSYTRSNDWDIISNETKSTQPLRTSAMVSTLLDAIHTNRLMNFDLLFAFWAIGHRWCWFRRIHSLSSPTSSLGMRFSNLDYLIVLSNANFFALLATFLFEESVSFVSVLNQELNATIVILVLPGKPELSKLLRRFWEKMFEKNETEKANVYFQSNKSIQALEISWFWNWRNETDHDVVGVTLLNLLFFVWKSKRS